MSADARLVAIITQDRSSLGTGITMPIDDGNTVGTIPVLDGGVQPSRRTAASADHRLPNTESTRHDTRQGATR